MAKTVLGNRKPVFDIEKLAREQNENIKKSGAANVPSTPVKVQPEQVRRDILKERGTIVRPLPTVKRTPHPPSATVPLPLKGKASAESRKENAINTRRRGLVPYSIQDIEAEKKRTEQLKADVERRTPTEVTANKKTYTYTPSSQAVGRSSYGLKFDVSKMGDDFINTNSPFGNYRITSKTGARDTGIKGASKNHAGIDRDVPEGTVISLPMDTTFHASGYDKSRGFWIEVKDASGNILHYQHLMDYGRFGEGEKLSAGTPIARSGSSGVGTAHLHEEYYSPDGRNITESYWAKYAGQSAEDIEKWKKEKGEYIIEQRERAEAKAEIEINIADAVRNAARTTPNWSSLSDEEKRSIIFSKKESPTKPKYIPSDVSTSPADTFSFLSKKLEQPAKDDAYNKDIIKKRAYRNRVKADFTKVALNNWNKAKEAIMRWDTLHMSEGEQFAKASVYMTDSEVLEYSYIYGTRGEKEANSYLDAIMLDVFARADLALNYPSEYEEFAKKAYYQPAEGESTIVRNVYGVPVGERQKGAMRKDERAFDMEDLKGISEKSLPFALVANTVAGFGSAGGYLKTMDQATKNLVSGEYEPLNPYDDAFLPVRWQQEIFKARTEGRGAVEKTLNGVALSMSQSLASAPFGAAGLVLMGTNAASQKAYEGAVKGVAPMQAFLNATATGAIEVTTEKLPFDQMRDAFKSARGVKKLAKDIFITAGLSNAGEEAVNNLAGTIADNFFYGDKSEYVMLIEAYKKDGLSNSQAASKAFLDKYVYDTIFAAASGYIQGAAQTGVTGTIGLIVNRVSNGNNLSDTLKTMSPEELSKVKTAFANIEEKVKSGKITTQEEFDADEDVKSIRFSVSPDFETNYDNWVKDGRPGRKNITVGRTSEALQSIGVKEQRITWDTSKINDSLKKHSYLNDNIMKQIPQLIDKPIIVMQSKSFDSRITMFGEVYDGDGLPVMAILELLPLKDKSGVVLDEIKVVSTHSRKTNNSASMSQTQSLINTSKILYVEPNKNRTDSWLTRTRLQLPFGVTNYGPINKISYPTENVNGKIEEVPFPVIGSKADKGTTPSMTSIYKNDGIVNNFLLNQENGRQRQFGKTQKKFFDAFGVEVVMDESLDANAEVLLDDGVVKVSPYADIDDWKITRHEFTHLLKVLAPEAYELYARLAREEIGDRWDAYYAEAKRDYTAYYEKKGKEVTDDLIEEEVLARYAEGLDNNDFIRKVARENTSIAVKIRNILKRIVDKIKAVFSSGERAGTPENIKKIITAKDAWENAAVEAAKNKRKWGNSSGGSRESIYKVNGKIRVVTDRDITRINEKVDSNKKVKEYILDNYDTVDITLGDGRKGIIYITERGAGEYAYSEYTKGLRGKMRYDKFRLADNVDELIDCMLDSEYEAPRHDRDDDIIGFFRSKIEVQVEDRVYEADVLTALTSDYREEFYDVVDFNLIKKDEPHPTRISTAEFVSRSGRLDGSSSKNSIYRKDENVNSKLSVLRNERTDSFRLDLFSQEMKFLRGLESENAHLKEVNDILKRFFRQTAMVHVDALHISEYAEHIKKVYETHMPAKEIATELQRIYTKMAEDGARAESDAQKAEAANVGANALFELAGKILEQSDAVDRSMYDRYAELRHALRTDGISISESDARDIPDFNDFRRQNMGRVKISSDGISVDSYYEELVELYPELFASEEITAPSDRLLKIVKVRDMLDPKYRDVAYTDDEAAALAVEMYAEYFSDENAAFEQQSLAAMIKDKYAKSLREEYNDKLKKTVDFYREQVEFYRNLNQNVEERIADVPVGDVQRNGFVDTEIKKEFSWYESGLKDTGVKVVRRQSPGGKKDTVLMTFERPTREALRNNEDYNAIISRVKDRIKQDWEEGKSGNSQFDFARSNVWRSFRRFFGDRDYRKMKELILDPLEDSKKQFMHIQEFYSQLIYKKVVKELGIKKGSELSALVQKYGEKVLTAEELEAISEEDMKKIQIADRLFRACYDGLIDTVNDTRRAIYPDADEKAQKLEDDILNIEKEIGLIELGFMTGDFTDVNGFNNYNLERIAIRQESAKELEYRIRLDAEKRAASFDAKITKLEEDMAATTNKTTKRYADLQERLAKYQAEKAKWAAIAESRQVELQEKIAELNEEFRSNTEYYKQKLDKRLKRLNEKLGEKKALLETDEITYGRTIQKRKDYYRHFEDLASEVPVFFGYIQQMTQDNGKTVIQAAKDYFERRSQKANIDNRLAGKSADTKPRAKWQSFAQHRTDGATAVKYDAVGGFLEYLPAAAYSAAIDPQISIFRTIAEDLAAKVDGKDNNNNLGSFIGYLQEYANDLAGKTNPIDRVIVDSFISRDSWNKLNWLTGRIKSNMIGLNVSSMFAQILNMPNAIATIKNPVYFIGAMRDVVAGLNSNGKIADRYKQSQFLNERYVNYYSKFEGGFSGNARKVSDWMLQAFDELGGRVIWNAAYRKAIKLGEKSPVRYADDLTRRMIAGRGIGEMQLYQKSRLMGMIMPFSVEVANNWDVIEDIARDAVQSGRKHTGVIKAAVVGGQTTLGLLMLFLANRLFNELLERLRGSDGGLLDPIGAIEEGIKKGDDVGEILGSIAGDAIGATPVGSAAATLYPEQGIQIGEYSTPTRSELFGSNDPTRYGTGNLFSSALKKPFNYLAMPTGGAQLDKTLTGIKAYKEGAVTKKNGDVLYEVDRNPVNAVKGALFGKSGFKETPEYYDKKDSGGIYDKYLKPKGGIKSEQFKELNRLIKIDDSIKPSKPGMSFVYNDVEYKPNGRYYDTYEKMYGRRASQYYNKLMLSSEYKAANDELKVVMVKDAFRAALSDAKAAYVKWQKSGADKDGGSFEQSFESDFIGKKIVGNGDAAKSFSAEGFNKGKGYAEVQHDGKTFILQGDAYNAYEQARYDAYVQKTELMNSSGTMTVKNEPRTKNNITKMKAILKQLVSEGSLDDGEAQQIYYKYARGEAVEVPAGVEFVLGRQEECQVKYADLTSEDKKKITKSLNTKIKNGEMTVAQAKQYIKDVQSGKKTVTKKRYITGDFNSLTDAQQEKVLGTLNDKVKDVALEVVKERLE